MKEESFHQMGVNIDMIGKLQRCPKLERLKKPNKVERKRGTTLISSHYISFERQDTQKNSMWYLLLRVCCPLILRFLMKQVTLNNTQHILGQATIMLQEVMAFYLGIFVSNLSSIAFDWYLELQNRSLQIFSNLEGQFVKMFTTAQHHIIVGDLIIEKTKLNESLVDYIMRWRNLSIKYGPQLQEQHVVKIFLGNIHSMVAFLLKVFTIKTFKKFISRTSNF